MRREQGVQPPEFMAKQLRPSGPDRCPFMRYQTAIQSRHRGVAQPGSASALGAEGRGFESLRPDQHKSLIIKAILTISATHLLFTATPQVSIL